MAYIWLSIRTGGFGSILFVVLIFVYYAPRGTPVSPKLVMTTERSCIRESECFLDGLLDDHNVKAGICL